VLENYTIDMTAAADPGTAEVFFVVNYRNENKKEGKIRDKAERRWREVESWTIHFQAIKCPLRNMVQNLES
jgi:hypothetical protein